MNAWTQLLEVQAIDSRLVKLEHRSAQLPERARLAEIDERLADVRRRIEAAEQDKHGLVRQQQAIEDEISGYEAKVEREEAQLYSGGSSDAGHLQDLQDEIGGLKRRIGVLEDKELELMEQVEPIDAQLVSLADEKAALDAEAVELSKVLAEAEGEIDRERSAALSEREAAVAGIEPEALSRYEKVRDRLGGVAVARLEGGVCGACHIKLSAVEHDRILHLPDDAEVRCEECDRFLVRT